MIRLQKGPYIMSEKYSRRSQQNESKNGPKPKEHIKHGLSALQKTIALIGSILSIIVASITISKAFGNNEQKDTNTSQSTTTTQHYQSQNQDRDQSQASSQASSSYQGSENTQNSTNTTTSSSQSNTSSSSSDTQATNASDATANSGEIDSNQ